MEVTSRLNPLEQISPQMIERVEVMSNPSAEYSAESMGGIVNIILKTPSQAARTMMKLSAGSYNGVPQYSVFGQQEGKEKKLAYILNTTLVDSLQSDSSQINSNSSRDSINSASKTQSVNLTSKLIYTQSPKEKYSFDLSLSGNKNESVENRDGLAQTMMKNQDDGNGWSLRSKLSGAHHLQNNDLLDWKVVYFNNSSQGEIQTDDGVQVMRQDDKSSIERFGGEVSYSKAVDQHFFKTGLNTKFLVQNDLVQNISQKMNEAQYSGYLQDEITVGENLMLTPGIRYEYSAINLDKKVDISYLAPSLHGIYHITSKDNFRASFAKTVKLPRLNELTSLIDKNLQENDLNHPDKAGNPNLKEESALSYELRYEHFFDKRGIVSVSAFYRDISDKIEKLTTYENLRYVERPYNAGEGKLWSMDLEFKNSLNSLVQGLSIFGNMTLQDSSLDSASSKRPIKGTSKCLYNLGIDHNLADYKLNYGASYRYVGGYSDPVDEKGISETQKAYGVLDLYAMKRLNPTFKLGMHLKNINHETIQTTTNSYDGSGTLLLTQRDYQDTKATILFTLEGKW